MNDSTALHFHGKPLSAWVEALLSADGAERTAAVAAWRQIGEALKLAAPDLLAVLHRPDAAERLDGVRAVCGLAEQLQVVVPLLAAGLKETAAREAEETVRSEATQALNLHLDPRATGPRLPALVAALEDSLPVVRFSAAAALGDLGREARPAVGALIHAATWDRDDRVRAQSAAALWRIDRRDRIAAPALSALLPSADEYVRWLAADCLGDMGARAVEALPALRAALEAEYKTPLIRKSLELAVERIQRAAQAAGMD